MCEEEIWENIVQVDFNQILLYKSYFERKIVQ